MSGRFWTNYQLERMPEVMAYARNDHLDFTIPYEWQGVRHEYRPDYLIRLRSRDGGEIKVILEVKGFETEQDRQKEVAARRWVKAVNHHGEFGRWEFVVCKDPRKLKEVLEPMAFMACRFRPHHQIEGGQILGRWVMG